MEKSSGWDVPPPNRRTGPTRWDVSPELVIQNMLPSLLAIYSSDPTKIDNPDSYFDQRSSDTSNPLAFVGDSNRNINAIHTLANDRTSIRFFKSDGAFPTILF